MSRLFFTQKEINFSHDIAKELMVDIVGQRVIYYPISELKNKNHPLYNENLNKVFDNPIELPALVNTPDNKNTSNIFGPEVINTLEVFIHHQDMVDKGINVSTGDFMKYGDMFYEISSLVKLHNMYGQTEHPIGYKLDLVTARKGQFEAPMEGPTDVAFTDPDAVQKEFTQTRGYHSVDGQPTGDKRALYENGVIEHRETDTSGVAKIVEDEKTGSKFYGDR